VASETAVIQSLVLVYDAGWNLRDGIAHLSRKLGGAGGCALCDITHGALREKQQWTSCKADLGLPIEAFYRDRLSAELRDAVNGEYPAVVARTNKGYLRLLGRQQLEECRGKVAELREKLLASAAAQKLSWG
jgi:hypothetical protein